MSAYPPQYTYQSSTAAPPSAQPVYTASAVAYGQPVGAAPAAIPIQRIACAQCGAVYELPYGASSFRCRNCSSMNGGGGGGCCIPICLPCVIQ